MSEVTVKKVPYPITADNRIAAEPDDLYHLLERKSDQIKSELNCVLIGTIGMFYDEDQTADIAINYKKIVNGGLRDYPLLLKVPIFILSGGKGYISMPIETGDQCLLLFNDRSLEAWWQSESGRKVPPQSSQRHDLSDAIALVGLFPSWKSIPNYQKYPPYIEVNHGNAILQANNGIASGCFLGFNRATDSWEAKGGAVHVDGNGQVRIYHIENGDTVTSLRDSLDELCTGLNSLCTALTAWQGDDPQGGTVSPKSGTIAAINAAKTVIINAKTDIDTVLA